MSEFKISIYLFKLDTCFQLLVFLQFATLFFVHIFNIIH